MPKQGRRLMQGSSAVSRAVGGQTASARAVAGPGVAATEQSATGPGSQVAGVSQVGQRVDACVRGPSTSAACQTLTTEDRSITCTDIAPVPVPGAEQFTCAEQAQFGKCDSAFIYLGAFCLQSCGRCGDQCVDTAPTPDFGCALALCNTTEVAAGPYCLKTCGRCSQAAGSAQGGGAGAGASPDASATATSGTGAGR
ncbi:glycoside hydrolase [Micractinium conductrix]|uniref:Glycoside hydrolase n=1 Tax=Micractinium conductrix TaxID=554055 RepID=A0A2P6VBX5_9CHLO|nr:glycoside hydrolase [Micractinium conductrix]|eukprot:PSC71589.1 glycoside hydrolase [Micractinium conductrix]